MSLLCPSDQELHFETFLKNDLNLLLSAAGSYSQVMQISPSLIGMMVAIFQCMSTYMVVTIFYISVLCFKCFYIYQGWTPRPAGNPPRRKGGFPPRPALWGGGGSPPRPVKMIKTAGKLRGKIKAQISISPIQETNMMEQYYNNEQCPIQPVNRICKRK